MRVIKPCGDPTCSICGEGPHTSAEMAGGGGVQFGEMVRQYMDIFDLVRELDDDDLDFLLRFLRVWKRTREETAQ